MNDLFDNQKPIQESSWRMISSINLKFESIIN